MRDTAREEKAEFERNVKPVVDNDWTLTELWVSGAAIWRLDTAPLLKALILNTTVRQLDFSCVSLSENYNNGWRALEEVLPHNTTLTKLSIRTCSVKDDEVRCWLARGLAHNATLTQLNLEMNDIGDDGAAALAGSLKSNRTLTELTLSRNKIEDAGAAVLEEALGYNTTLTQLYYADNKISAAGQLPMRQPAATNV